MDTRKTFNEYWFGQFRQSFGSSKVAFVNPIRRVGISYFAFQVLFELGHNEWHSTSAIITRLKELMSSVTTINGKTCWDSYCDRIRKSNGDVSANILHTVTYLQASYGKRLAEMHCCVDTSRTDTETFLRLNTLSHKPLRQRVRVKDKQQKQKPSLWSRFLHWAVALLIVLREAFGRSGN